MADKKIKIPDSGIRDIKIIAEIGEGKIKKLQELLLKTKPSIEPSKIVEQLSDETDITKDNLLEIIGMLFGIHNSMKKLNCGKEEIINEIIGRDELKGIKKLESVRTFLSNTLDNNTIVMSAKAARLAMSNQTIFCSASVYTDIRPSFPSDFTQKSLGAIILHQLEIGYHENDDHKRITITMDSNDLEEMKNEILRAEEKERYLRNHVVFKEIDFINI